MARIKNEADYQQAKNNLANSFFKILYYKDFNDITIKEICDEAGVAVGTFYYYYKNKQQIIAEKFRDTDTMFTKHCVPLLTYTDFFKDIFVYVSFYDYTSNLNGLDYMKQVFSSLLINGSTTPMLKRGMVTTLISIIESGQENGIVKTNLDPAAIACELFICLRGFSLHWCTSLEDSNHADEKLLFVKRYLFGIITPEHHEKLENYEL